MTSNEKTTGASEIFLKAWQVYQDIIAHNYMFHEEISAAAHRSLVGFNPGHQLNILDLGCGDASMVLPLLSSASVALYTGCDLSKPALDIAEQQLSTRSIPFKLVCDDMLKVIAEQPESSVDLVFSSYAVHHLNSNNKQKLIEEVYRVLRPTGRFLLIDIFRASNEDRAAYMRNYMGHLKETWGNLSPEAQALVIDHATEYDFPEQSDFFQAICQKSGFGHSHSLAKYTWHEAWLFSKI